MRKLNFYADQNSSYQQRRATPLPYFVASSSSSSSSSSDVLISICLQQIKELNETMMSHLFNPNYYKADDSWEIGPKEWILIYFDHVSDWHSCENEKNWNVFGLKKHVFFVLRNNSPTNVLKVPRGTPLLDILILHDIKSYIIPAPRTFAYSEELM
jgi:hypothetical protein